MGGSDYAAVDPLYFFLHANVERQRLTWMYMNRHLAEVYWNYPTLGPFGDTMEDALGAAVTSLGFTWRHLGFTSELLGVEFFAGDRDALLTHADFLCWAGPFTAPYTYDTLQAMMDATVEQAPSQKGKSRLVTRFVRSPVGGFFLALAFTLLVVQGVRLLCARRRPQIPTSDEPPGLQGGGGGGGYDMGLNDAAAAEGRAGRVATPGVI